MYSRFKLLLNWIDGLYRAIDSWFDWMIDLILIYLFSLYRENNQLYGSYSIIIIIIITVQNS